MLTEASLFPLGSGLLPHADPSEVLPKQGLEAIGFQIEFCRSYHFGYSPGNQGQRAVGSLGFLFTSPLQAGGCQPVLGVGQAHPVPPASRAACGRSRLPARVVPCHRRLLKVTLACLPCLPWSIHSFPFSIAFGIFSS